MLLRVMLPSISVLSIILPSISVIIIWHRQGFRILLMIGVRDALFFAVGRLRTSCSQLLGAAAIAR